MKLCGYNCKPCCDYCIYVKHETISIPNSFIPIKSGPIACKLHNDKEHQKIAESCGYCDDFHCINVED